MTLVRMQITHKAQFIDPAVAMATRRCAHWSSTLPIPRGWRHRKERPSFILEQELNTIEEHDSEQFRSMCALSHWPGFCCSGVPRTSGAISCISTWASFRPRSTR